METDAVVRDFDQEDHRFTFEVSTDVRDRLVGHGDEHFPLDSAAHRDVWPLDLDPGHLDLIEKRSELAELTKVKAELLRVLTENQTLKISYQKLLDIRKSKSAESVTSSKHKIIAKLQQELSEKTLYCNNITEKLVSYKKKYKSLKASQSKYLPDSAESTPNTKALGREEVHEHLDDRVAQLEQANRQLSIELEAYKAREQLCGHQQPQSGFASDSLPMDWQRLIEKLKLKANDVSKDATAVLTKVNDLKELLTDLLGATPSTSMLGEERVPFANDAEEAATEEHQAPEDGGLGKRKKSRYEEFAEEASVEQEQASAYQAKPSPSEKADLSTTPVVCVAEVKQELMNELSIRKCISFGQVQPLPESQVAVKSGAVKAVTNPKITFGTSDEDESSLTTEQPPVEVGFKDLTLKLQQASDWSKHNTCSKKLVVQKRFDRSKQASRDSPFAEDVHPKKQQALSYPLTLEGPASKPSEQHSKAHKLSSSEESHGRPTAKQQLPKHVDSSQECLISVLPPALGMEPTSFKPLKLSMPPFLRPAETTLKQTGNKMQEALNFSFEDIPIKRLPAKIDEPSCIWKRVAQLVEEQKKGAAQSKQNYFSLLREFRATFRGCQAQPDYKIHLNALLQESLGSEFYRLKDLLSLQETKVTDAQVHQVYVLQSFLYLVFVSHYTETCHSSEEQSLLDYLLSYRNLDPFLADKFDKIVEIVTNNKHKPHPVLVVKQQPGQLTAAHHFALLKVVFQHLVQSLERIVYVCQTEEVFSSQILANKLNFGELKDSSQYVLGKASAVLEGFEFFEGLPDYLLASRWLFGLIKATDLVMFKSYYESLRGVFSNHKYRNTSQQLVVCLLFKQMSVVTKD